MRHFTLPAAVIAICLMASPSAYAQKTPFKFGKIAEEELEMTECDFSADAKAMVLGERGSLHFKYDSDKGFQYQYEYTVRIKVFQQEADELANVMIRAYQGTGGNREEVIAIKGATYNLEDGKIVETRLGKEDIYEEQINERWKATKFALPGVKAGSVLEYKYTIVSDYLYTLRAWQFQRDIPVKWSEYEFTIPEYFNYQTVFRGYAPLSVNDSRVVSETFTYSYEKSIQASGLNNVSTGSNRGTGSFQSESKYSRWVVENLTPLKHEPYMTSFSDYLFQVDFQLMSTKFPNSPMEVVAGSYEKINKELMDSQSFGKALGKGRYAEEIAVAATSEEPLEKAVQIYEQIKGMMKWNEFYGIFASKSLNQIYKDQAGSVADINLLLTSTYQSLGLEAYPVVLSTRSNGKMHPTYPSYDRMNYMVCAVKINDKFYFADASRKGLKFNLIPEICLNGSGWMVTPAGGTWVSLKNDGFRESVFVKLQLSAEEMIGSMQIKREGYAGIDERNRILEDGEEKYTAWLGDKLSDWEVNLTKLDYQSLYEPVMAELELSQSMTADKLYLNPVFTGLKENPFKEDLRSLPVDIPYGTQSRYIFTMEIPDGYTIEELPQPAIVSLPDNGGIYRFNSSQAGKSLMISIQFELNKLFYSVEEYPLIQQFYDIVSKKNNEIIVLSRR